MRNRGLIGIVGPLGPAQLACLRSWQRAGLRTVFFQIGGRRLSKPLSRLADVYRFLPESALSKENIQRVGAECDALGVVAIAALSEQVALKLWEHRNNGGFQQTHFLLNQPELYAALESKLYQARMAEEAGLPVLATATLTTGATENTAFESPQAILPVVLRPDIARLVQPMFKAEVVGNAQDLQAFLGSLRKSESNVVSQPFVAGPNLIVHGSRAVDGSWDHHEAYLTEIKFKGLAVSLKPLPLDPSLLDACRKFEAITGLNGVFHYDFIVDEHSGSPFFLEVNPRFGGTTAKVYAAGYDEPSMLVAAHLPSLLPPPSAGEKSRRKAISRIAAVKCALSICLQPPSSMDYPANSRFASIVPILKGVLTYSDEVFSFSDPLGNLAYLSQTGT